MLNRSIFTVFGPIISFRKTFLMDIEHLWIFVPKFFKTYVFVFYMGFWRSVSICRIICNAIWVQNFISNDFSHLCQRVQGYFSILELNRCKVVLFWLYQNCSRSVIVCKMIWHNIWLQNVFFTFHLTFFFFSLIFSKRSWEDIWDDDSHTKW